MNRVRKYDVIGMLEEHGAIVSGHFELLSGLHTPIFIDTSKVVQHPHLAQKFALGICAKFPQEVEAVLALSSGAVLIGREIARRKKSRSVLLERTSGGLALKRESYLQRGEKILVVQDVLTTGRSTSEAVSLSLAYGAKVVGVAAVVDRSLAELPFRIPFRSLVSYPSQVDPSSECALCARGIPLQRPLKGRE